MCVSSCRRIAGTPAGPRFVRRFGSLRERGRNASIQDRDWCRIVFLPKQNKKNNSFVRSRNAPVHYFVWCFYYFVPSFLFYVGVGNSVPNKIVKTPAVYDRPFWSKTRFRRLRVILRSLVLLFTILMLYVRVFVCPHMGYAPGIDLDGNIINLWNLYEHTKWCSYSRTE